MFRSIIYIYTVFQRKQIHLFNKAVGQVKINFHIIWDLFISYLKQNINEFNH